MLTEQEIAEKLQKELKEYFVSYTLPTKSRIHVRVDKKGIKNVTDFLFNKLGARYVMSSGLDLGENFGVIHFFSFDDSGIVVNVKTIFPKTEPHIDSIANITPGAAWIERETNDLFGITFDGHPDPRRFILPDKWPSGEYPLLKDYSRREK
ncbi:MAG: NADH-quinone oxidoreductase subunit C [Candidatus Bathyarchaeota archaeon]